MSEFIFKPEEWANQHNPKRLSTNVVLNRDVYVFFCLETEELINCFRETCPYSIFIHTNQDIFAETRDWCEANITGYWYNQGLFHQEFMFENEDEASLFKLTWGGSKCFTQRI